MTSPGLGRLDRRRRAAAERAGLPRRAHRHGPPGRRRRPHPVPGPAVRRAPAAGGGRRPLSGEHRPRAVRHRLRRGALRRPARREHPPSAGVAERSSTTPAASSSPPATPTRWPRPSPAWLTTPRPAPSSARGDPHGHGSSATRAQALTLLLETLLRSAARKGASMMAAPLWHLLTGEYPPQPGGVSDYTAQLASALADTGAEVHVWTTLAPGPTPDAPGVTVHRGAGRWSPADLARLNSALDAFPAPRLILAQHVPSLWGYRGLNLAFGRWLLLRRGQGGRRRARDVSTRGALLHTRLFDSEADLGWVLAATQRRLVRDVLRASNHVYVSTPSWEPRLRRYGAPGRRANVTWLPVPSNIPVVDDPAGVAALQRRLAPRGDVVIGTFGTFSGIVADLLAKSLPCLLLARADRRALLLGRGGERFAARLVAAYPALAGRVDAPGSLPHDDVSRHLQVCDLFVQPYPDGVTSRRTSTMAALAHGRPVVTNRGEAHRTLLGREPRRRPGPRLRAGRPDSRGRRPAGRPRRTGRTRRRRPAILRPHLRHRADVGDAPGPDLRTRGTPAMKPVLIVSGDFVKTGGMDRANYALALLPARSRGTRSTSPPTAQAKTCSARPERDVAPLHRSRSACTSSPSAVPRPAGRPPGPPDRRCAGGGRGRQRRQLPLERRELAPSPETSWTAPLPVAFGSLLRRLKRGRSRLTASLPSRPDLPAAAGRPCSRSRISASEVNRPRTWSTGSRSRLGAESRWSTSGTDPDALLPRHRPTHCCSATPRKPPQWAWPPTVPACLLSWARWAKTAARASTRCSRPGNSSAATRAGTPTRRGRPRRRKEPAWRPLAAAAEAGLASRIRFLGFRRDLPAPPPRACDAPRAPSRATRATHPLVDAGGPSACGLLACL